MRGNEGLAGFSCFLSLLGIGKQLVWGHSELTGQWTENQVGEHKLGRTQEGNNASAAAKSLQSCPTLHDPIDGIPPGSPVPGILQAGTLQWVVISFSKREIIDSCK